MEVLQQKSWWIPALLFLLHQISQYGLGWQVPWVDAYLDPLVALPILLGLLVFERRLLFGVHRLDVGEVVIVTIVLAVIFEEGFPRWQPAFIRDRLDYLMYFLGSFYFWNWVNPEAK